MKRFLLVNCLLLSLTSIFFIQANITIYGKVLTEKRHNPILDVTLFIDNTTLWCQTNKQGVFKITIPNTTHTVKLIITHSLFERKELNLRLQANSKRQLSIKLAQKLKLLQEVSVTAKSPKIKARYRNKFWRTFLGEKNNSHPHQKILNKEVVHFSFDKEKRLLKVTASDNIKIENRYLGYLIRFNLSLFTHDYRKKSSYTIGNAYFSPLKPKTKKEQQLWIKRRKEAYLGSTLHFCRTLFQHNMESEGFEIYSVLKKFDLNKYPQISISPKERNKQPYPSSVYYYNWTRVLQLSSKPLPADSLYRNQLQHKLQRIHLPSDLVIVYLEKSQKNFIRKYYYKGITQRKKKWYNFFNESIKPQKQFYIIRKNANLILYPDGSIMPNSGWIINNITIYGTRKMLPYNFQLTKNR